MVAGLNPRHVADTHGEGRDEEGDTGRGDGWRELWLECEREGWRERCKGVELDGRCEGPLFCCADDCLIGYVGGLGEGANVGYTV